MPTALRTSIVTTGGARHLTSAEVYREVDERWGREEISDSAAAAIASWWQSPAGHGLVMHQMQAGHEVTLSELLDAIHDAQRCLDSQLPSTVRQSRRELDMLATWALNQ